MGITYLASPLVRHRTALYALPIIAAISTICKVSQASGVLIYTPTETNEVSLSTQRLSLGQIPTEECDSLAFSRNRNPMLLIRSFSFSLANIIRSPFESVHTIVSTEIRVDIVAMTHTNGSRSQFSLFCVDLVAQSCNPSVSLLRVQDTLDVEGMRDLRCWLNEYYPHVGCKNDAPRPPKHDPEHYL